MFLFRFVSWFVCLYVFRSQNVMSIFPNMFGRDRQAPPNIRIPPKVYPPPKIRRKNAATVNAAEFLKCISRRKKSSNTSLLLSRDERQYVRNLCVRPKPPSQHGNFKARCSK